MKIWVTGGSGSLGGSVLGLLQSSDPKLTILAPNRTELALDDSNAVMEFVSNNRPTHVIHLAAEVYGISGHSEKPAASLLTNTKIDHAVFSALLKYPPNWIYYSSTVAAYGFPYVSMPLNEKDWLVGLPHSSEYGYAMAKRHALSYLNILRKEYQTDFVYGLTTNLFGTGDRFLKGRGHVVISLLERALIAKSSNSQLEVWGNGSAVRDFLSTKDAAVLILELLNKHMGVVNIASGQKIMIETIAQEIVRIFELSEGYRFVGINEGITERFCSVEKLSQTSSSLQKINSFLRLQEEINLFKKYH